MAKKIRNSLWAEIESSIQRRALKKDKNFKLGGSWKKFIRKQGGYRVFAVDGKWLRNNLCFNFGHGGHGFVHEFIPLNEIWIATHHYEEGKLELDCCGCKRNSKSQKVSKEYFDSTTEHEILECRLMKKGMAYWPAHNLALKKEIELGLLDDPFDDR